MKKAEKDTAAVNAEKIYMTMRWLQTSLKGHMLNKARDLGLSMPQFMVLHELRGSPGITMHELSERLDLPKSTVSRIVDQLVKNGKVKREIPDENRRTVKIYVTPEICNKTFIRDAIIADIAANIKNDESERIVHALTELKDVLSRIL